MQNFNIVKEVKKPNSYRSDYVIGTYDLNVENLKEEFIGNLNIEDEWNVGLIIGKSGSGKSTIAKELWPKDFIESIQYTEICVLDDFPKNIETKEICLALSNVGFSSPPSWLKPYSVLSNGEKMRCDVARIMLEKDFAVFDEFTSVIDRNVAKIGSNAIQKYIRKKNKKFVAVTCHYDVEDWLLPDWVFNTDNMEFIKKKTSKDQISDAKFIKQKKKQNFGTLLKDIII
jgi:ABC-type ATPase with predicted acetyltransferase domain